MITKQIVADPRRPYKSIYAFVLACLTAASGIWLNNPYVTGALVLVTALGTYFIPNPLAVATTTDDGPVMLSHPDDPGAPIV